MFDITKTKAVLWDLDDTLYSRINAARQLFPGMFRKYLYCDKSDAFIEEAADYLLTQIPRNKTMHPDAFRALGEKYPFDKPLNMAACTDYYYSHYRSFMKPFPEQLEVIRKLKSIGVKNAIVTNITPELLELQKKKVATLGIADLFDLIIYSAEFGIHKPDPRIFDHAARQLGVPNDACVFVGDDPNSDVAGALSAGMEVVWLDNWRTYDGSYLGHPCVHRVHSVSEYFPYLRATSP